MIESQNAFDPGHILKYCHIMQLTWQFLNFIARFILGDRFFLLPSDVFNLLIKTVKIDRKKYFIDWYLLFSICLKNKSKYTDPFRAEQFRFKLLKS